MGLLIQPSTELFPVAETSDVGAARRAVGKLARTLTLSDGDVGAAELATAELATNLEVHAGSGHVLVRAIPGRRALEVIAVDRGPGVGGAPPGGGGLGVGLEAVDRMASTFDLFSRRAGGTVALARFEFGEPPPPTALEVGGVSVPAAPFDANGDGWAVEYDEAGCTVVVVDGLGHGPSAHEAAQAALTALADTGERDLRTWLQRAHDAMRSTRGGVASVARVDLVRGVVEFAGIGNVSGTTVASAERRGLASRPGLLGTEHRVPRIEVVEVPWKRGSTLVLWSDGLRSGVRLDDPPDLLGHDPAVVAAALHRDFARGNDDATVVVVQERGARTS
ncbi:MAG: SpoIIE family protein phosphatase [Acidimicrobiia bacterium]|nr:SpoIIE family protein phosphatase [Acidimicrobiia bacterium]